MKEFLAVFAIALALALAGLGVATYSARQAPEPTFVDGAYQRAQMR